ncbi:MAG: MBL fold metallo-hydrolase [Candidatus Kapaibacterium sp.]
MDITRRNILTGLGAAAVGSIAAPAWARGLGKEMRVHQDVFRAEATPYLSKAIADRTWGFDSNPRLPTILSTWKGTPKDSAGRYLNNEFPHDDDVFRLLEWQLYGESTRAAKAADTYRVRVDRDDTVLKRDEDCIVWLGHATFYIRIGGIRILTDPVFGNIFVRNRLCSLPFSPADIKDLDVVLLSHVHQDHADPPSMSYLRHRNAQTQYLCGLGAGELIGDWTGSRRIQEAGWFQQYDMTGVTKDRNVEIFYLPARHWSRRGLFDANQQLWGSFVIRANGKTIFWGGDSGYGSHFKIVRELFGDVDVCIAGVGAFKPEWFMAQNHTSPASAVRAADDMGARMFIPMHYGTFELGDESVGEPVRILESIRDSGCAKTSIRIPRVGERVML